MKNNLVEMRRNIMKEAHAMCREMKAQGFEFNYHVQLGLNIKYLWETVGTTIDTLEDEHTVVTPETTTDSIEEDTEAPEEPTEQPEVEEAEYEIEYINHVALPNNKGYSFLFRLYNGEEVQEFTAVASRNHRLPIAYDACPQDIEFLEQIKTIINEKTHIYDTLENDYAPDYRYHRGEDLFIYYDEAAEIFKGYYCGNDIYGGRAFVFDINNQEGPCSRAIRQLLKDHKAERFGAFTSMKSKGTTITKWRERIIQECRVLYKLSKNTSKINEAKLVIDKPWNHDEKKYNAAIRFLAQMDVKYDTKYDSYAAAIDAKLRSLSETYDPNSKFNKVADKLIAKFQDRIHELKLTNLYRQDNRQNNKPAQSNNDVIDEFANMEL